MIPEIFPKDCKTIKEAEEYLNSYGIYVWHKGDDVNYIKYLLNIGCFVYVATAYDHRGYYLLKKENIIDEFTDRTLKDILLYYKNRISDRPNKLLKFIKKGFNKYVKPILSIRIQ